MIVAADLEQLAELAFAEAERYPPRSPGRRAASHLLFALTEPRAKSIVSALNAIASFGSETTQSAALELLHKLAAQTSAATAAAAPTRKATP